jgi:hypothetical protein
LEERLIETTVSRNISTKRAKHYLASIPWDWVTKAAQCPGKALHVALAIRHQVRLGKNPTISLGSRFLNGLGVSKDAKRRALVSLEQEGLIQVEQKQGNNPRVTLVECGDE